MRKIILEILNNWDPIGLTKVSPEDEYLAEALKIESLLLRNSQISIEELVENIRHIFISSFDNQLFYCKDEEISVVAKEILKNIK